MRNPSLILAAILASAGPASALGNGTSPQKASAAPPASTVKAPDQSAALTGDELYWLKAGEREFYERESAKTLTPAARQTLVNGARKTVADDLPSFARAGYRRLVKAPVDAKKVSAYLDALIAIRDPKDQQKLAAIKKGKGLGAGLQRGDALQDYTVQMASVKLGPDNRPLPGQFRDEAVVKVAKYRGLLHARSGKGAGKTHAGGAKSTAVLALTDSELDWLTPQQRNDYLTAAKGAKASAARRSLYEKNRAFIAANLPADKKAEYDAAVAEMSPVLINSAIAKAAHYSGTEAELSKEEIAALAAITKDKAPAGYTIEKENAQVDYTHEMASVPRVNGVPKGSFHLRAHEIVVKYRAMLAAAAGKTPAANPADGKAPDAKKPDAPAGPLPDEAMLTDKQQGLLTKDEKAAYDKEIADAKGDPAKLAAVNSKYRKLVAIKDKSAYESLRPEYKKDVCAPYKNAVLNSGGASVASSTCDPQVVAQKTAACKIDKKTGKADEACIKRASSDCGAGTVSSGAPASPAPSLPPITDPDVKAACAVLNANDGGPADPQEAKKAAVKAGVPDPCAGTTASPGAKPGTDKDCTPKEDKGDPAFYKNLANGMAFGVFGLVLGSFFGGPLVMAAAALVLGGGAFALSSHLNPKPKDDKKGG